MSTGLLVIMGSGETAPTMVKTHRAILSRVGSRPAYLLDTPYGFQSNVDDISARAVNYFAASVGAKIDVIPWRRAPQPGLAREQALAAIHSAGWLFAGPGSPTYALRQWRETPLRNALADLLARDAVLLLASAAALTLGTHTVPVYEIYKAGLDPHWVDGLDLMREALGLPAVVIPHFDNAEGGHHDTRFCYLGEQRLSQMERELPEDAFILGVDEHTAVLLDLTTRQATVQGRGAMTIRRRANPTGPAGSTESVSTVYLAGTTVSFDELSGATAGPSATAVRGTAQTGAPPPDSPARSSATARTADTLAGLGEQTATLRAQFDNGLADRDVGACVEAVLALEQALQDWSADTLTSTEAESARAELRRMIVRLGELAETSRPTPRDLLAPLVEGLLEVRGRARDAKDFATADQVRDRLAQAGIEVRDTPTGYDWHPA